MTAEVKRPRTRRAKLGGRTASLLLVLIVCTLLAACGSTSPGSSSQTTSAQNTTQTGASTGTGTTTSTTPQKDPSGKLDTLPKDNQRETLPAPPTSAAPGVDQAYLKKVFEDAQRFWEKEFREGGARYLPAHVRFFTGAVHSGCGAQEDTGPFYCGASRTVYLDVGFFELLTRQAGIGRFGLAYIVGHELGHHVQHVLGIDQRLAALNQQDPSGTNARSVRTELQADCLAGVWAHSSKSRGELTDADMNHALKAAALVGDDFQQKAAGQVVDSAAWTHGSSAQRQHWLKAGFESGSPDACDTFTNTSP